MKYKNTRKYIKRSRQYTKQKRRKLKKYRKRNRKKYTRKIYKGGGTIIPYTYNDGMLNESGSELKNHNFRNLSEPIDYLVGVGRLMTLAKSYPYHPSCYNIIIFEDSIFIDLLKNRPNADNRDPNNHVHIKFDGGRKDGMFAENTDLTIPFGWWLVKAPFKPNEGIPDKFSLLNGCFNSIDANVGYGGYTTNSSNGANVKWFMDFKKYTMNLQHRGLLLWDGTVEPGASVVHNTPWIPDANQMPAPFNMPPPIQQYDETGGWLDPNSLPTVPMEHLYRFF